jgi:hypothetical protein
VLPLSFTPQSVLPRVASFPQNAYHLCDPKSLYPLLRSLYLSVVKPND